MFWSSTPFSPFEGGSGALRQAWYILADVCVNNVVVPPYLNQVLPLFLGDERLELRCCKCVDKTSLGDNEKKHLRASEDGEFIGLDKESVGVLQSKRDRNWRADA